jgi:hypothetical protein
MSIQILLEMIILLLLSAPPLWGQHVEALFPAPAQEKLNSLIPVGKKFVTVNVGVIATTVRTENGSVFCNSSSSGKISGTVNDFGDIDATVKSSGSTNCWQSHTYHYTMILELPQQQDSKFDYFLVAGCGVKWRWNHCGMPDKLSVYPMVLEREKHGEFNIYAATQERVGGKMKVATFHVLKVLRLKEE